MPFGPYSSFQDCVSQNRNKRDPEAYCATIQRQVEGKKSFVFYSEPFKWEELKSNTGTRYITKGYITTGDRDLIGDIVTQHCMDSMLTQISARVIKLDMEHETWGGDTDMEREKAKTKVPIGKINSAVKDEKGVFVETEYNPHHKRFNEAWGSITGGYLDAYSIAFIPTTEEKTVIDGKRTRLLDDMTLLNVAVTGNPMNTEATFTSIVAKSLNYLRESSEKSIMSNTTTSSSSNHDDSKQEDKMTEEKTAKTEKETESKPEVKADPLAEVTKELKAISERLDKLEKKSEEEPAATEPAAEPPAEPAAEPEAEPTVASELKKKLEAVEKEVKTITQTLSDSQLFSKQEDMTKELKDAETKNTADFSPLRAI